MKLHPVQRLLSLAELTVAPHVRRQVEVSSDTPVVSDAAFCVYAQSSDGLEATLMIDALEWLVCHSRFPGIVRNPTIGTVGGAGTIVKPAAIPTFFSLDASAPDFVDLSNCSCPRTAVSILAFLWVWVDLVHAFDRRYVEVSAAQPFLSTLGHSVMMAVVNPLNTQPLFMTDAAAPSHPPLDSTGAQPLPDAVAYSGAFPSFWILMHGEHFIPGRTVDMD